MEFYERGRMSIKEVERRREEWCKIKEEIIENMKEVQDRDTDTRKPRYNRI